MRKHEPFEDDGRTVADMSDVGHSPLWLPRRQNRDDEQQPLAGIQRPWEQEPEFTGKERFWAIMGAMKATLLICSVYLIGLIALVALLLFLWC